MEVKDKIIIAQDFGATPGARYKSDGQFSGEAFLLDLLLPKFEKAVAENYILLIDLDGVWGYPSSFVSGSFGKLSVNKGADLVLKHIEFKSDENPMRLERIIQEIKSPKKK
ncbi:STAS-like domain-containing protein [Parafilimonas sp.]|uniref:STAS-like domain-containing protein n=1 Tax=Parafilimonas sp. TaxID=1969739 RepID=UPI003F7E2C23